MSGYKSTVDADEQLTNNDNSSENGLPASPSDGTTVSLHGADVSLSTAVETLTETVENPEAFGIASENSVLELRTEVALLRERVEQKDRHIRELYSAVDYLARGLNVGLSWEHAEVTPTEESATVDLEDNS